MSFNKTGRIRGLIWKHIRSIASKKKEFTPSDIVGGPIKDRFQSASNCFQLFRAGELRRIRKGVAKCNYSEEPVYSRMI